jgi:hypothetical protein
LSFAADEGYHGLRRLEIKVRGVEPRRRPKERMTSGEVEISPGVGEILARADREVDFARKVFNGLVEGRESAQNLIAWEQFIVMDQNVGEAYLKMPVERERYFFRKSFIINFSDRRVPPIGNGGPTVGASPRAV